MEMIWKRRLKSGWVGSVISITVSSSEVGFWNGVSS